MAMEPATALPPIAEPPVHTTSVPYGSNGGGGLFHDGLPASTTVLRLRGLPYSADDNEVRRFFTGFELAAENAVLIITQGFHRGEGYVRFANEQACTAAHATRNRATMGERYIELYPSNDTAFDQAQRQQQQLASEVHHVIRMRGLPFAAELETIKLFFEQLGGSIVNIVMCAGQDGRFTGDAFVDFVSEEAMRQAIGFDRRLIGTRYVEIFESSAQERDAVLMSARRHIRGRGGWDARGMRGGMGMMPHGYAPMMMPHHHAVGYGHPRGHPRGAMMPPMMYVPAPAPPPAVVASTSASVVRVRGLPFSASEADVAEFLQGVSIRPQGVHMVYNANERPTGEAFVEVTGEKDVEVALQLNRKMMGTRYIEVYRSTPADMMRLQGADPTTMMAPYDPNAVAYAYGYPPPMWQAYPSGPRR